MIILYNINVKVYKNVHFLVTESILRQMAYNICVFYEVNKKNTDIGPIL